jgi:tRNA-Thr(GGU) m(6)t(6)A37 methyltransferase TsaA
MSSQAGSSGRRPGEIEMALPRDFDAGLYFIGTIHTPWKQRQDCPKNGAESTDLCTIAVKAEFVDGLQDIDRCSHLWILYFMDQARRNLIVQRPSHYDRPLGVFSLRSPSRPNPIALSAVSLIGVERSDQGAQLSVIGLDCVDGTPLVDIKPYFASTDARAGAEVGWHKNGSR